VRVEEHVLKSVCDYPESLYTSVCHVGGRVGIVISYTQKSSSKRNSMPGVCSF